MNSIDFIFELLILAMPIATASWTVTHEEVFRELREWGEAKRRQASSLFTRKLLYLLACEFCFSFYVAFAAVAIMRFRVLDGGWRGFMVAWLSEVWIANVYMSLYAKIRLDMRKDRVDIAEVEHKVVGK
jgi:hypothetical protein